MPKQLSGQLVKDESSQTVQTGRAFVTADISASVKTSPLSYSSSVLTITVPLNAIEFIVNPSTALRISEVAAMTTYDVIAANSKESIGCAGMDKIYIIRDSVDGVANFKFTTI